MAKKQFSSSLEETILESFKKTCALYGISMNTVLEGLIQEFNNGEYSITITKNGVQLKKMS